MGLDDVNIDLGSTVSRRDSVNRLLFTAHLCCVCLYTTCCDLYLFIGGGDCLHVEFPSNLFFIFLQLLDFLFINLF